ncbi:MMPL family transporter [Ornithinicoccus hortensis]|uniref:RND superfamily putative drug exporter n=1 Tax=Ornithinicoccus hortensis TaxID=82346 RepID=A0A542YWF8_9MICO|nr:MMPL family transporter [Ornithinicoccus hortensis]TQL52425.1 RND superfamily putative drug exporter [Ornithinicoccus hortensis]
MSTQAPDRHTHTTHHRATHGATRPSTYGGAAGGPTPRRTGVAGWLTSRRGAWVALALALVAMLAVLGPLRGEEAPARADSVPATSESAMAEALADQFPGSDVAPVLVVLSRDGAALTEGDLAAGAELATGLSAVTGHEASPPLTAEDGRAAILQVPMTLGADNSANADTIGQLRDAVAAQQDDGALPAGLTAQVTGGPAFGADVASAFDGANITLLLVTVGIVALLLILTYRSPILFLVPLAVVGTADQLAAVATAALGRALDLQFDAGIVSVLVFGAGTNYALLLISRYREGLHRTADHRAALATAWRGAVPAVLASNVTVVLALLTLSLATLPGTRGLGVASAAGLVIALAAVLLVLPPALAVVGRRAFWPFVPRPGTTDPTEHGVWSRIAGVVVRRPARVVAASVALLAVLATGLLGTSVGLTQTEKFRVASESAAGLEVLAEHFPAGEASPLVVVAAAGASEEVEQALTGVDGVVAVRETGTSDTDAGELVRFSVVGEPAPGTDAALDLVDTVRTAVQGVPGADALVGGATAQDLDARAAADHDLLVVAPLVLAVALAVLVLLLRALVAPLLLLVVNVASSAAAIGAGAWIGRTLFGFPALDVMVPLLAFLFLVALGIDYTIFLVHRARQEAAAHGTRRGMVRAVAHTGAVITSAGVVLAGVFAALGVLPLVTLGQLGLIVGLGVLLDTLVVRTVLVPALFALLGDRMWWPSRPAADVPANG